MKIILKNKTNMSVYSNIPENSNKVVLKYAKDSTAWKSTKYQIQRGLDDLVGKEYEIQIQQLELGGSADIFPPRLNIVNGIKLDQGWEPHFSVDGVYIGKTKNELLIDIIQNHRDLYIYGVFDN